jgi:hypothetical protein
MFMSDSLVFLLVVVLAEVVPAAIFLYASYWAFSIRRALVSRIYRNQALWLGVVGVIVAIEMFLTYSTNPVVNALIAVYYSALYLVVFGFVDSIIPVARRSDPLLRSIIGWEKLRIPLWIDAFALAIVGFGDFVFYSTFLNVFILPPVALSVFGVSGIAIVTGARRSGDPLLRASLKWIGVVLVLSVLVFVAYAIVSAIPGISTYEIFYSYPALLVGAVYIMIAYALYKSARSLAPVTRLRLADTENTAIPPRS